MLAVAPPPIARGKCSPLEVLPLWHLHNLAGLVKVRLFFCDFSCKNRVILFGDLAFVEAFTEEENGVHKPVAVFDAGIGSYAIVAAIKAHFPNQDILYFADRASFPYGGKNREQLLHTMRRTLRFLEGYDPSAIVIASNAPSIMVLEDVQKESTVPVFGVYPPLAEALACSASGHVGIMGVRSLIESEALTSFVGRLAEKIENVSLINASPMVELVESGVFLFAPEKTQEAVASFLDEVFSTDPAIDVLTLSSTHLPWLRAFFEKARPQCRFLDPAEDMIVAMGQRSEGTGIVRALVTEDENYDIETFRRMLESLNVDIPLEAVVMP